MDLDKFDVTLPPIERAEALARLAHEGQFRKDGKTPYIKHPKAVADLVKRYLKDLESGPLIWAVCAAWLHDVIEDTDVTLENLYDCGFNEQIIDAVDCLTKIEDESYLEYLLRIMDNDIATEVKFQDIVHNISDNPSKHQKDKYLMALHILSRGCKPTIAQIFLPLVESKIGITL